MPSLQPRWAALRGREGAGSAASRSPATPQHDISGRSGFVPRRPSPAFSSSSRVSHNALTSRVSLLTLLTGLLECYRPPPCQLRNREDHVRLVRLARFTDSYNAEVYVNPDLVTFIRQSSNDVTTINFGEEHTVTVKMQVGAVASALFSAGKP
jgi:hypothetical protein